jgi:hypothetical protein
VRSFIGGSVATIFIAGLLGIAIGGFLWWFLLVYPWRVWKKGTLDPHQIDICDQGLRIRANDQSTRYLSWAFLESVESKSMYPLDYLVLHFDHTSEQLGIQFLPSPDTLIGGESVVDFLRGRIGSSGEPIPETTQVRKLAGEPANPASPDKVVMAFLNENILDPATTFLGMPNPLDQKSDTTDATAAPEPQRDPIRTAEPPSQPAPTFAPRPDLKAAPDPSGKQAKSIRESTRKPPVTDKPKADIEPLEPFNPKAEKRSRGASEKSDRSRFSR